MEKEKLKSALVRGGGFLRKECGRSGSFLSLTSPHADFRMSETSRSVFGTAIIAAAAAKVPETRETARRAAAFLIRERSPRWTFNYWERRAPEAKRMPYPDDLDDTAAALTAIARALPARVNGETMAEVVKTLTALEVEPGGPYRTWLVAPDAPEIWRDVDLAVQSGVGRFLFEKKISLPRLGASAEKAIAEGRYVSRYYPGPYAVIYFLSAWYRGRRKEKLAADAARLGEAAARRKNPLELALAAAALANLGKTAAAERLVAKLLPLQKKDGSFAPRPFCLDPVRNGRKYFGGSAALTTAIALEAMAIYLESAAKDTQARELRAKTREEAPFSAAVTKMLRAEAAKMPALLRSQFLALSRKVQAADKKREITLWPYRLWRGLKDNRVPEDIPVLLGFANLCGWMAYTAYDDVLDGDAPAEAILPGNAALRAATRIYMDIFPFGSAGRRLYLSALDKMDAAASWEWRHARNPAKPPDYGDYSRLAEKSLGHALGPLSVFLLQGFGMDAPEFRTLEEFSLEYLSLRQLLDDAHDWKADLAKGRVTAAGAMVLSLRKKHPGISDNALFWRYGTETLLQSAKAKLASARRRALRLSRVLEPEALLSVLRPLARAIEHAETERRATLEFIAAYRRRL